tara:strand:- start:33 stop:887 length:855 start_codon:yes stop_codon:yes gene_type:complete
MRALVTGGAGFVGTNLIKRLLSDGHKVVSLDNYISGFVENEQEGCQYFNVDLREVKDYSFFMDKPDVIFHLAALARIQPSFDEPHETLETNINGTLNILEFARQKRCQVVYAGSSSYHAGIYRSPYAFSKGVGGQLCKLYSSVYDLNTSIFRFYNVYGPHQIEDGNYSTVIGIFERQYRNNEALTIVGDGEQRRDFTYIDDIVYGLVLAMGQEFRADTFELGSGKNYSINEVVDLFGSKKTYLASRTAEYDKTLCDYSKANDILGWKPQFDLGEYIKKIKESKK